MIEPHAFEEWRLSAPTVDGERRLQCHGSPLHIGVVVPRLTLARCHSCDRRIIGRHAWADEPTRTRLVCAPCHNRGHQWPG